MDFLEKFKQKKLLDEIASREHAHTKDAGWRRAITTPLRFDLASFLRRKEKIGGMVIREEAVELTLLEDAPGPDITSASIRFYRSIPLLTGVIVEGEVKRPEALLEALILLKREAAAISLESVIVSIPTELAQFMRLSFPLRLPQEDINTAVELAAESSFPFPRSEMYYDHIIISGHVAQHQEVLIGVAPRRMVDPYITMVSRAGFSPVAVETHAMSIARAFPEGPAGRLAMFFEPSGVNLVVYNGTSPHDHFYVPKSMLEEDPNTPPEHRIVQLVRRMLHAAEAGEERLNVSAIILVPDHEDHWGLAELFKNKNLPALSAADSLTKHSGVALRDEWMAVALGSGMRGLIPRKLDTIISLMPVGTEQAYERARALSLADFLQKFSMLLGAFFVVLFAGALFFVDMLEGASEAEKEQIAVPPAFEEMRASAQGFNERVAAFGILQNAYPAWEKIFSNIDALALPGVVFHSITVNPSREITIEGHAATRDTFLAFKSVLERSSDTFISSPIPLALLLEKENIGFRLNLQLKDPKQFFP